MSAFNDLLEVGIVVAAIVILKDFVGAVEDTLGITPPPSGTPPAGPVMQTVKFSPTCPAGYIMPSPPGTVSIDASGNFLDSSGNVIPVSQDNCIQVTGAIHA